MTENRLNASLNPIELKVELLHPALRDIGEKILLGTRLSFDDGIRLFEHPDINDLGMLANYKRFQVNGDVSHFVINQHLNPTNICEAHCLFCSFRRDDGEEGAYLLDADEIKKQVEHMDPRLKEIHIVSGLHPHLPFSYYLDLIHIIRRVRPDVHVKAFTAVEIAFFADKYGMSHAEVLKQLSEAGLEAMPGGGAEVFSSRVRRKLCPDKATADEWLDIHRTAHHMGIKTNATILYGHIETHEERVDHFIRLRDLQDETGGFLAFIPLAYQHENNRLSKLKQHTSILDLKVFAVSRLMMDNFPHIKAYWATLGEKLAQIALHYGADEMEGTVMTEIIMKMAGSQAGSGMTVEKLLQYIREARRIPVERDALYNPVKNYAPLETI